MYSRNLESCVLHLAAQRGYLKGAAPEDLDADLLLDPEALQHSSHFGPRLDRLAAKGLLSRSLLEKLVWEVVLDAQPVASLPAEAPSLEAPAAPVPLPDLESGLETTFSGRFLEFQLIGEGATAKVYKAFDAQLQRWVALKFLKTTHAGRRDALLKEARAQAKVEHPNVCRVHEVGEMGGHGYILMEYARGGTLDRAAASLELEAIVGLVRDVAEGVHAAHRHGLVHLDLKPGNILLQPKEDGTFRPLVTDFGMVLDEEGGRRGLPCPMGTPPYSSPEQVAGRTRDLDRRSDIHALGVVLYVMLCQRFPFEALDFHGLLEAILHQPPVPASRVNPRVPEDLEGILETCMAKDLLKRYPSAQALADDLQRYLSGEPVQAMPQGRIYRARKWAKRNRALAWVLVAASLVCAGLATAGLVGVYRVRNQARLAKLFLRDADEMETILKDAHRMPFHDISPEVAKVEGRMQEVRDTMAREGRQARGPGLYALGRAHLALGDPEKAQEELQEAWNAGFQAPEVAAALGAAYGRTYQLKLAEFGTLRQGPIRWLFNRDQMPATVMARLQKQYLEPANRNLREGKSSLSPYQRACFEGQTSLQEGQPELALQRAQEAAHMEPGDAAAPILEAAAYGAMAARAQLDSQYARMSALLDAMESALDHAADLERSSPEVHEMRAQARSLRLSMRIDQHLATPEDLDSALGATDRLLQVDPRNPKAYVRQAIIQYLWSEYAATRGEDVRVPMRHAIQAAEKAQALKPSFAWASFVKANALYVMASTSRRYFGEDPGTHLRASLREYEGLLKQSNFKEQILQNMGDCYFQLGLYEATHGIPSAEKDLDASVRHYQQALDTHPNAKTYFALASPLKWLGRLADGRGDDPIPFYDRAIEAYQRALALSPDQAMCLGRLADLHVFRAERRARVGNDPSRDVDAAMKAAEASVRIKPDLMIGHANQAEAALVQAEWNIRKGQDPRPLLARAGAELAEAGWRDPKDPDLMLDHGKLAREQVRWGIASGGSIDRPLKEGLDTVEKILAASPGYALAYFLRAELLLLAAKRPDRRREARRAEAYQALDRSVALNPNLQRAAAALRKEYE